MRGFSKIILLLLLGELFAVLSYAFAENTTPLFIWTQKSQELGFEVPKNAYLSQTQVATSLLEKAARNGVSQAPAVIYLIDELSNQDVGEVASLFSRTETKGSSFLAETIKSSVSSHVSPFAEVGNSNVWNDLMEKYIEMGHKTQYSKLTTSFEFDPTSKLTLINIGTTFNSNTDELLRKAHEKAVRAYGEGLTSFLTGGVKPSATELKIRSLQAGARGPFFIIVDPQLIAGMFYTFFFLLVVSIYLCCMDCVEAPTYYATRPPFKGKEFL